MSVTIFFCYAREDEPLLNQLKAHLRPLQYQGLIDVWYDRDISAGTEWGQEIKEHLNSAQIILLLVSPDFIASDYITNIELKRALERHERGEARVIPIILRRAYWQIGPLGKLQALPTDAKPVRSWSDVDEALFDITEGIRHVVEQLGPGPAFKTVEDVALNELNKAMMEKPSLDDLLSGHADGEQWTESSQKDGICKFEANEYSVTTLHAAYRFYLGHCKSHIVKDLLLQVHMKIIHGSEGGLVFRWRQTAQEPEFYYFYITTNGYYGLERGEDTGLETIHRSFSEAIKPGLTQPNTIAVRASGSTIDLFANEKFLFRPSEIASFQGGGFGFASGWHPSKVAFSHAKMWEL